MFKNSFNSSKGLNNISSVIVQVPQLPIMPLVSPPERILFQNLVLLEVCTHPPSFIISQSVSIFLKQSVNTWYSSIPRVLQNKSRISQQVNYPLRKNKHIAINTIHMNTEILMSRSLRGISEHSLPDLQGSNACFALMLPAFSMHIQPRHAVNQ